MLSGTARPALTRAAIRVASEGLRDLPKPEPELKVPAALHDAGHLEGVPDEKLGEVEKLAWMLRSFADSVRVAERNDRPIPAWHRETIKPKRAYVRKP